MTHTTEQRDGMEVLVVSDMGRRFDPETGKELKVRQVNNLPIVHASEIARYYGLDLPDTGYGDNLRLGVWSLVNHNMIGQRVNYNSESEAKSDRIVRHWEIIKDPMGKPVDTKSTLKEEKVVVETDDGMYARLDDVLRFAAANGWTPGGGWPSKVGAPAPQSDVAGIVAAVLAALGVGDKAAQAKKAHV